MVTSSACTIIFGHVKFIALLFIQVIVLFFIIFLSNVSMASMKREQLRASPCFTPFPRLYPFTIFPFIMMSFLKSSYNSLNISTNMCSPVFCRSVVIYCWLTESKAFWASSGIIVAFMSSSLSASLTAAPNNLRLSEMLRPFKCAVWVHVG